MKIYVDTTGKQLTASKDPEPKNDQSGKQRSERDTGRLLWVTQVFVMDETGGEVIQVTTAGEKPKARQGELVSGSEVRLHQDADGVGAGTDRDASRAGARASFELVAVHACSAADGSLEQGSVRGCLECGTGEVGGDMIGVDVVEVAVPRLSHDREVNRPGVSGDFGVSRVPRSRDSWDSHATVMMRLRSNSIGVSHPSWL